MVISRKLKRYQFPAPRNRNLCVLLCVVHVFQYHYANLIKHIRCFKGKCIIMSSACSHKLKMGVKLKADYGAVLHLPILREGKDRASHLSGSMEGHQNYAQPGEDESIIACQSHS